MFLTIAKKVISHEKTTLKKLNKIESNLTEIKVKLGVQGTEGDDDHEKLTGIGMIESYDFKREQLLSEINSKQFKSTNFGKKNVPANQPVGKQEKP